MVRRTLVQLTETIERSKQIYRPLGAKYHEQDKLWRFPNGARLRFAYLERDADANGYQGHSYTRVYIEEIGNFPSPVPIMKLMATLRSGAGVPCGFRATGNPGGPGHQWVKARYIDPAPLGWEVITSEFTNPFNNERVRRERVYIPSRLDDNRYLGSDYVANLHMSGNAELVRAWLEGDWSVIAGAFFPEFNIARHVVQPLTLPKEWTRFRSMDWGSAKPFSVGWWAISDGSMNQFPRGALIRYREWYGMKPGEPNVGTKMVAEDVGAGIVSRETLETISNGGSVLDPSAFDNSGGPSYAERISNGSREAEGKLPRVIFRRADNKRVRDVGAMGGWDQVRARLVGDGERPMLYVFNTCRDLIRTLPALQHDELRPEDVDSDAEDHACFAAGTIIDNMGPIERVGILTRCATDVVRVSFEDGRSIVCTPDHQFMGYSGKWRAAKDLQSHLVCSAVLLRNFSASGITAAALTSSARAVDCIARSGFIIEGLFQKAFTFTTRIATALTTPLRTWSYSPALRTFPSTASSPHGLAMARGPLPPNGTEATRAAHGTLSIIKKPLRPRWLSVSRYLAIIAGKLSRHGASLLANRNSVLPDARHALCVSVERLSEKRDVYCLGDKSGTLSVCGLVASNCDETRYACMSRPYVRQDQPKKEPVFAGLTIGGANPAGAPTIDQIWKDHARHRERM